MKFSKGRIYLFYLICAFKLFFTFVFFRGAGIYFSFLAIISIPVYMGLALYKEIALFCLIGLAVTLLLWVFAFVFSLFGIQFKKARRISMFLLTTSAIWDFIAALICPNWVVKIIGGSVSLFTAYFGKKAMLALKEKS